MFLIGKLESNRTLSFPRRSRGIPRQAHGPIRLVSGGTLVASLLGVRHGRSYLLAAVALSLRVPNRFPAFPSFSVSIIFESAL